MSSFRAVQRIVHSLSLEGVGGGGNPTGLKASMHRLPERPARTTPVSRQFTVRARDEQTRVRERGSAQLTRASTSSGGTRMAQAVRGIARKRGVGETVRASTGLASRQVCGLVPGFAAALRVLLLKREFFVSLI
jgi:hypothetical protein